jgi:hypothetical protein
MCRLVGEDHEATERIRRGLATAALLALESDDIPRAKAIAKIALEAQQVPFRRM